MEAATQQTTMTTVRDDSDSDDDEVGYYLLYMPLPFDCVCIGFGERERERMIKLGMRTVVCMYEWYPPFIVFAIFECMFLFPLSISSKVLFYVLLFFNQSKKKNDNKTLVIFQNEKICIDKL